LRREASASVDPPSGSTRRTRVVPLKLFPEPLAPQHTEDGPDLHDHEEHRRARPLVAPEEDSESHHPNDQLHGEEGLLVLFSTCESPSFDSEDLRSVMTSIPGWQLDQLNDFLLRISRSRQIRFLQRLNTTSATLRWYDAAALFVIGTLVGNRVAAEEGIAGLDITEVGVRGHGCRTRGAFRKVRQSSSSALA
jgi:hypothetical protein